MPDSNGSKCAETKADFKVLASYYFVDNSRMYVTAHPPTMPTDALLIHPLFSLQTPTRLSARQR